MAYVLSRIYTDHGFSTAFVCKYPQRGFAGCHSLFHYFTIHYSPCNFPQREALLGLTLLFQHLTIHYSPRNFPQALPMLPKETYPSDVFGKWCQFLWFSIFRHLILVVTSTRFSSGTFQIIKLNVTIIKELQNSFHYKSLFSLFKTIRQLSLRKDVFQWVDVLWKSTALRRISIWTLSACSCSCSSVFILIHY